MTTDENAPTPDGAKRRRRLALAGGAAGLAAVCAVAVTTVTSGSGDDPAARGGTPTPLDLTLDVDPQGRSVKLRGNIASVGQADIVRSAAYGIDNDAAVNLSAPDGGVATDHQDRSVSQLVALMSALPSHMSDARVSLDDVGMVVIGDARGVASKRNLARLFDRMEASGVYVRRNIKVPCDGTTVTCLGSELGRAIGRDGVRFLPGSIDLTGVAYESVEDVSFMLTANPGVRAVITGRTPSGQGAAGARLARTRAEEVAAVITGHEVAPGRVVVRTTPGGGDRVDITLES